MGVVVQIDGVAAAVALDRKHGCPIQAVFGISLHSDLDPHALVEFDVMPSLLVSH